MKRAGITSPLTRLNELKDAFLHMLFPHLCSACGNDVLPKESMLCMRCLEKLPETHFEAIADNPVEKKFRGRLSLVAATAQYYFTRESLVQHLMHQLKYKGNRELGMQLGQMMGQTIMQAGRFTIDALIPLPLFAAKERKRGYNQATVLCRGMAERIQVPVLDDIIIRSQHTETQTQKGRIERWQNMEGKFELVDASSIQNKHILLVDDVVTTGATLEACGVELLKAFNVKLSLATLSYAAR